MIFKRVANPKKSARKAERVSGLTDYIVAPEKENGMEKCVHYGALGFVCNDFKSQQAEMIALAVSAVRSPDPIKHYMLSWRVDEKPTVAQVDEAVAIFVKHLGLDGHQVIYGMHDDTDHMHVHIAVNRVHPMTGKVIEINGGFDKDAGHQAIALIEAKQGWQPTKNAQYIVNEHGELVKRSGKGQKPLEPPPEVADHEVRRGEKSAYRLAQEIAAPILLNASSWQELHTQLAEHGMSYMRKGSGALLFVGEVSLKASAVHRAASLSSMEKRLGLFQEKHSPVVLPDLSHLTPNQLTKGAKRVIDRIDRITAPGTALDHLIHLDEHRSRVAAENSRSLSQLPTRDLDAGKANREMLLPAGVQNDVGNSRSRNDHGLRRSGDGRSRSERVKSRSTNREAVPLVDNQPGWSEYIEVRDAAKSAKAQSTLDLRKKHSDERSALAARLKAERNAMLNRDWTGKGVARNALSMALAEQQSIEKVKLREQQADERKLLQAKHRPMPLYRDWKMSPAIVGKIVLAEEAKVHAQIADDQTKRLSTILQQMEKENTQAGRVYKRHGVAMFRDEGRRVAVLNPQSDAAIAAALAVAQERFGRTLALTGDQAFQRRVVAVAVAHGIPVRFADPALEKLRQQTIVDKTSKKCIEPRAPSEPRPVQQTPYGRIQAHKKQQREAERAAEAAARVLEALPITPEPADELTAADWLEMHPEYKVRQGVTLPASGRVVYCSPDGSWVQSMGRVVAVRPPIQGVELLRVGDVIDHDRAGVVIKQERDNEVLRGGVDPSARQTPAKC